MTGKTHRVGGVLCVLGGFTYMESKGLLIPNVTPVLQLLVMYPFAIYGSTFSDLDHNSNSSPSKDVVSVAINKLLHLSKVEKGPLRLFNAKHRSWQTHSDLFLALSLCFLYWLMDGFKGSGAEREIVLLVGLGFSLGLISHIILDMLTPEGIWSVLFILLGEIPVIGKVFPRKIRLVPYKKFFYTGGKWESFIRKLLWLLSIVLFIRILYSLQPYEIFFKR